MNNDELSQKDKVILKGRIYPAIQACVSNRYKIVLGIFAYYSFIFTSEKFFEKSGCYNVNLLVSIIFTFFVLHNLWNYWRNAKEQKKIEDNIEMNWKNYKNWPEMEIGFAFVTVVLIWGGYSLIK